MRTRDAETCEIQSRTHNHNLHQDNKDLSDGYFDFTVVNYAPVDA